MPTTPLASVLGYLETWRLQHPQSDPLIEVAYRNGNALSRQLQSLLQTAKSQQNLPEYHCEPVDLTSMLQACQQAIMPQLARQNVSLTLDTDPQLTTVGDEQLLERLWHNLLENALRHSPPGNDIVLHARCNHQTNRIECSVTNQVCPEAPHGELGIGTRIVKSILMLHHSALDTESNGQQFRQSFELEAVAG
ncbi:sensor histidine kinase [Vibrio sp.]|uniref:sensor histidine kinase n=1 Tax=Vibrio sp. TaxID=678 RepID=UPI003D0EEFDA